ncbi:MAG TPA: stage II sporulation protein M [Actinomycetota bacterium]|nr:stage II sporulation protein M [Actinomycetota bacterium]
MNLGRFTGERRPEWDELERLVASARDRPERLGYDGVRRLGGLYRAAAADLSLARRLWPDDPVRARLESLVARAGRLVYQSHTRRDSALRFLTRRYWQRVAEAPAFLATSAALLLVPMVLGGLWGATDTPAALGFVPPEYARITEADPGDTDLGLSLSERAAFSSAIFTNNVRVSFLAFAGGVLLGLGTAAVLLYNGVTLGVVGGLAVGAGNGPRLVELVSPHGVLELTCIVVAGAAGLRMGWAVVEPGRLARGRALKAAARDAAEVVLGTALWLVLAGLVEGFVTPTGVGLWPAVGTGVALALVYWTLLWRLGRRARGAGAGPAATHGRAPSP